DDQARRAETHRLRRRQGGKEAEQLAEEDRAPRQGLREEELRRAALGSEGEDAQEERGERHQEEDELDQGGRGAREVLHPAPPEEHIARAGDREGKDGEDEGEDLRPARANREAQLLAGAEPERR